MKRQPIDVSLSLSFPPSVKAMKKCPQMRIKKKTTAMTKGGPARLRKLPASGKADLNPGSISVRSSLFPNFIGLLIFERKNKSRLFLRQRIISIIGEIIISHAEEIYTF